VLRFNGELDGFVAAEDSARPEPVEQVEAEIAAGSPSRASAT
jgi:hypothetical protein